MRRPVLVFDYVNRIATQLGKDPKADREASKSLNARTKGVARAAGGRPASTER